MDHSMDHSMDHDMMDMTTTTTMDHGTMMHHMTSTASAAMASGTGMAAGGMDHGMDHSSHGGMGEGSGPACKISMLWNWETVDACFISDSWQITSGGMFAGCCVGVICLVICLEFLRRVGREYDAYIIRRHSIHQQINANTATTAAAAAAAAGASDPSSPPKPSATTTTTRAIARDEGLLFNFLGSRNDGLVRPTLFDQLVRATLHMMQFAIAYFAMLLAMYYNGYIIICIFIGAFIGSFIFAWEPLGPGKEIDACAVTKCCG